jgi:hypothetical protein
MKLKLSKQRLYASLLILGSGFLFFRTIVMIYQGSLEIFVLWVAALLILELMIDAGCLFSSVIWWISNKKRKSILPLRLAAAVIIVHAVRVLIYVLGRLETLYNFDVRPEYRVVHHTRWSWEGVYFAGIMSGLSVIVLLIIWVIMKRAKKTKG